MKRFLILLLPFTLFALDNSILPMVEKYELVENLPAKKFSDNQLHEIKDALAYKNQKIRIVTFNMLFNDFDAKYEPIHQWAQRLPRIIEVLNEMQPDIICTQELSTQMIRDLLVDLGKTYAYYGPKDHEGEHNVIFFKKNRFINLQQQSFVIENGKILNTIRLKDRKDDRIFAVFNTHLTFTDINLREREVRFIADTLASVKDPVIFTGDLNFFAARLDLANLPAYDGDYLNRIFTSKGLVDARDVSLLGHLGPIGTFSNSGDNGIPFKGTGTPGIFPRPHFCLQKCHCAARRRPTRYSQRLFPLGSFPGHDGLFTL